MAFYQILVHLLWDFFGVFFNHCVIFGIFWHVAKLKQILGRSTKCRNWTQFFATLNVKGQIRYRRSESHFESSALFSPKVNQLWNFNLDFLEGLPGQMFYSDIDSYLILFPACETLRGLSKKETPKWKRFTSFLLERNGTKNEWQSGWPWPLNKKVVVVKRKVLSSPL